MVKKNDLVKVGSGPYAGMEGRVSGVSNGNVSVNVQSAGQRFSGMQRTVVVSQSESEVKVVGSFVK